MTSGRRIIVNRGRIVVEIVLVQEDIRQKLMSIKVRQSLEREFLSRNVYESCYLVSQRAKKADECPS